MLVSLDTYDGSPADRRRICQALDHRLAELSSSTHRADRRQVGRVEDAVARDPEAAFSFDDHGWARLRAAGLEFEAGRFACPSLGELRRKATPVGGSSGRLRLWILSGTSPVTDIGALQAGAPASSLFQVASQFNCLESPGAYIARVQDYFGDPTQGPRASISAYPGTLLRHYAAPAADGTRFVQPRGGQLNLLHRLVSVECGYLLSGEIRDPAALAAQLEERFEDIEVGVHEGVPVVLGANWDGHVEGQPRISQVFTSTLAAGGYGSVDFGEPSWQTICRQLQRAAYLGTLTAAAALGQERVVLTLIGGGVFGNPLSEIWSAILWAAEQLAPRLPKDLTVIVNGRDGVTQPDVLQRAARKLGGDLIHCSSGGASIAS